ncbi:MAG TPA: hypothetical protein VK791_08710, partial [bacterium]|nr:hypothetical protein [bacterium]
MNKPKGSGFIQRLSKIKPASKDRQIVVGTWSQNINLYLWLLSLVLGFGMFLLRGNTGLDLADEGYLWYGVDRVCHGEVPFVDFDSYDPARYYWSAFFFRVWHPGVTVLRFSETMFQIVGLFFGLLSAKRITENRFELAVVGLILTIWMFPGFKYFDCVVPMVAVFVGCRLFEMPSKRAIFGAGAFAGLAFFVGRNHGVYIALAFFGLLMIDRIRAGRIWISKKYLLFGFLTGLSPFFLMFLFLKGFPFAYFSKAFDLLRLSRSYSTPLLIPFPWSFLSGLGVDVNVLTSFIHGSLLLVMPLFYLFCLSFFIYKSKDEKVIGSFSVVCAVIGVCYLHYAFYGAEYSHLSVAISPFWLGLLGLGRFETSTRRLFLVLVMGVTLCSIGVESRLFQLFNPSKAWPCVYSIGSDNVRVDLGTGVMLDI